MQSATLLPLQIQWEVVRGLNVQMHGKITRGFLFLRWWNGLVSLNVSHCVKYKWIQSGSTIWTQDMKMVVLQTMKWNDYDFHPNAIKTEILHQTQVEVWGGMHHIERLHNNLHAVFLNQCCINMHFQYTFFQHTVPHCQGDQQLRCNLVVTHWDRTRGHHMAPSPLSLFQTSATLSWSAPHTSGSALCLPGEGVV